MNHRIVSTVVVIIVAVFAAAAGLFTWAMATVTPPSTTRLTVPQNPHADTRRTERCLECHTTEQATIPVTHRHFSVSTCEWCHTPARRVLVPHSITMGDVRCPLCHSDPDRDHGVPANHLGYKTDECLLCHPVDAQYYSRKPAPAGLALSYAAPIPHQTDGLFEDCTYCHQIGERRSLPANHRDFAMETCTDCHEPGAAPAAQ